MEPGAADTRLKVFSRPEQGIALLISYNVQLEKGQGGKSVKTRNTMRLSRSLPLHIQQRQSGLAMIVPPSRPTSSFHLHDLLDEGRGAWIRR